jgi:hypothetical protein
MNQPGLSAWLVLALIQYRREQMKENEDNWSYKEQAEYLPKKRKPSKVMAMIGKQLTSFGSSLEERYGMQPAATTTLNQQSNVGGC